MANQSTLQFVDIADIRDNVLILQNGSLRLILEVSAINFELRSEEEQSAILQNFQSFLNSVDFPIQIVMNSRRFDIDQYLKTIETTTASITNELLRVQALEYGKFVKELSTLANIMSKRFFVVVPFYVIEAPSKQGIFDSFRNVFKSKKVVAQIPDEKFQAYRNQLLQRAELVYDGLLGMGLRARILEQNEIMNLFYSLYNPGVKTAIE